MSAPVVMLGRLGWGNRKTGVEAYGPGDRWGGNEYGDLLGDALEREGCHEGTRLVVIAFPNRFTKDEAEALVTELKERFTP